MLQKSIRFQEKPGSYRGLTVLTSRVLRQLRVQVYLVRQNWEQLPERVNIFTIGTFP
jgi:hypothetical protein